jgi:hypothetical protein
MGCGVALQAKRRMPQLPRLLGTHLARHGNTPCVFAQYRVVTLPTKDDFRQDSSLDRIESTCKTLDSLLNACDVEELYIPLLGCGAGRLHWDVVKPIIESVVRRVVLIAVRPL